MQISSIIISCLLLIAGCESKSKADKKLFVNIDSIFVEWNRATTRSLVRQIELAGDSSLRKLYENRLEAFRAYVGIDALYKQVNAKSIRYKFLNELIDILKNVSDVYIIEANRSGEQVEIRSYVICLKPGASAEVYLYNFINRKWVRDQTPNSTRFKKEGPLGNYLTDLGKGFNSDDVIITQIQNSKITDSEYYLYTTLSTSENFKELFSLK